MMKVDELPEILGNVRIYHDNMKIFEGKLDTFLFCFDSGQYSIDYISCSMNYESRDHAEAFDLFAVVGFVDIYVS